MIGESVVDQDWSEVVRRLGGSEFLDESARETKALVRRRGIASAADLLRLVLAYCLGDRGLRLTAAWASAVGLADISNVALLQRVRGCGDWLAVLIGRVLAEAAPSAGQGRLIRIVDATAVPQAGPAARKASRLWRIHGAFDLPGERFGHFELTDQSGGERLDRIPVIEGEIRLADRAYLQPARIAEVLAAGADIVVRAGWKSARWLDGRGEPLDLVADLARSGDGPVDRPIRIARPGGEPLTLRLVATRKPPQAAAEARRKARRNAQRENHRLSKATLVAADWVILLTSLDPDTFATADVLALYRLRWRIELAFKRLKSLIGLKGPPAFDERSARTWILAHLLLILLLEPLLSEFGDSPRWAQATA